MFNAGRCLETGQGVDADILQAGALYETAARGFGHFDAVHTLGGLYDDGALKGGPDMAVQYLLPAAKAGQWAQTVRDGFERYVTTLPPLLLLLRAFSRAALLLARRDCASAGVLLLLLLLLLPLLLLLLLHYCCYYYYFYYYYYYYYSTN